MAPRSKVDRLTDRERGLVKARLEHPDWPLHRIAKEAGYAGSRTTLQESANAAFKRPEVRLALLHPRPEVEIQSFDKMTDLERRAMLLRFYGEVVQDRQVAISERIRAATAVAEMTAGAKVPVGVDHRMLFNMEKFVELAGGKPDSEQVHEILPN